MRKYSGLAIFSVALLLQLSLGVHHASPASAASPNCGSKDVWLYAALHQRVQHDTTAALADIDIRRGSLCANTNHPTATAAWSMVQTSGPGGGYAQIGYAVRSSCGDCRTYFWQVRKDGDSTPNDDFFGSPGTTLTKRFKVTWQNGSGEDNHFHLYICDNGGGDCVQYRETTWNPNSGGWPGQLGSWAGEAFDSEDDIPGTDDNRVDFNNIQVRTDTGPWHSPTDLDKCLEPDPFPCNSATWYAYHFDWVNTNSDAHFRIWTDPINR